ncbi:MAG: lysophospholipid acyltransferase family protein [Acidiferrobacterales bacterium]|nr:lysophospholipid acyltransferase family protein [Acidiferrobacterales bacterium]
MSGKPFQPIRQLFLLIATAVLLAFLWLVNLLPLKVKIGFGQGIGWLLYKIPNSRTHITRVNLGICYPSLSDEEREEMVKQVFMSFGASIIESAMGWWDRPEQLKKITELRGQSHLDKAIELDRGVILLGAHFSTIDISGALMGNFYPCYAIYRLQNNWLLNRVMIRGRESQLKGLIPHTAMREAARKIMKKEMVWYSPDQDMGIENSVFAPFFGHPAATLTATAKLAKLTKAPIVMLASYRKPDDSGYVLEFLPIAPEFPVEDEVENASMINNLIEQGVKLAPTQYYWFHRRFKSQPGLEKSALYQ